jgi:RNA polymerase sigma-70 factor, ECF subfamily
LPQRDLLHAEPLADDRALAVRSLRGEQAAMRQLVERHEGVVLRVCQRMLGNRHDAEDVVQETFVRALKSLGGWDQGRAFKPWLLAIAANRCRTALARRRSVACDTQLLADELPARHDGRQALGNLTEEVAVALGELRDELRQAFELFHYEELAYAEIADVLEAPMGTVKTWIHRARQEVAAKLIKRGVVESVKSSEDEHAMQANRAAAARVAG